MPSRQKTPASSLEIATLPLPQGRGVLGITHCPGRCDLQFAGAERRELGQDLAAIRAWGATALVTLIEPYEFELLRVDRLGEMAEAEGLEWHHLPIPDMDVPDWHFDQRWIYSGLRLRRLLRQGGRIVLHCRAGLGRAGTIAAHLLVELGVPTAEAISQVRRVRQGAIQTPAQEDHVEQVVMISPRQDEIMARRLAYLLGGALGDAFGHVVEFDKLDTIRRRYGPTGLRAPQYTHGHFEVSDDTQMTFFTLEGLTRAFLKGETDQDSLIRQLRLSYLDWAETQGGKTQGSAASRLMKHASMHVSRCPEQTALEALLKGSDGSLEKPVNGSRSWGGVIRGGPIALLPALDTTQAFQVAARAAALTHGHPSGHLPAGVLAAMLRQLTQGISLQAAVQHAREIALTQAGHEETVNLLDAAMEAAKHPHLGNMPANLGQGWTGAEALALGTYTASISLDFATVMATAANQDGNSATVATLAGQLYGAQYGLEALPHAWIRRLDVLDALCDLLDWGRDLWTAPPS